MKILLTILFLLTTTGQIFRLWFFDRIGILPLDIFVFIIIGVWILKLFYKKETFWNKELILPTTIFFSWALFSLLFNTAELFLSLNEFLVSFAYYLRYLAYFLLLFVCVNEVKKDKNNYWLNIFIFSAVLISIFGFLQLKYFPNFYELNMDESWWDPHIWRFLSTWFDPNFLWGYIAFTISILIGVIWDKLINKKFTTSFFIYNIIFILLLISLLLTFSRSAYLAFLIAWFIFALFADKRLIIIGIICVSLMISISDRAKKRAYNAVISATALFTQTEKTLDPTSQLRVKSWKIGWDIFQNKPITWTGFNTLKIVQKKYWSSMTNSHAGSGIDSSILTVMSTTGIIGIISFLWIYLKMIILSFKNYKKKRYISLWFISGLCGIFIHSMFVNTLFFNLFLPYLFLWYAISINYKK